MVVLDIDIGAGEQWRTQEARRQVRVKRGTHKSVLWMGAEWKLARVA